MLVKLRTALGFYTCLPVLSHTESLDFQGIALYAPWIGLLLGLIFISIDGGLAWLSPQGFAVRSLVLMLSSLWLTGGLHLDGAIDTGDGLAVSAPERRLEVMADSRTGAFGVMTLVCILLIKLVAWTELLHLPALRKIWLMVNIPVWARWGQLHAIGTFPYLKAEGKGKIHASTIDQGQVWLTATILIGLNLGISYLVHDGQMGLFLNFMGLLPLALSTWLYHKLGGHTGDTYGAIVEWSEALMALLSALYLVHQS
jgi:adenosylcobinamide-GDP ribazoletransferase